MENNIDVKALLEFADTIQSLDPIECDGIAINYINFIEQNNLDINDYGYLQFYASFNGLLDEDNRLKEEFREEKIEQEILKEDTILTEATKSKKEEIVKFILDCINIVDRSGLNAKKYKDMFDSMSDEDFSKWMNKFLDDPDANFYLELLPNKSEPTIYDIEKLLAKLKIPKEEYVYYRDNGFKDNPLRSRERCSVGYVTVRRLQQILSKKNTYSLDIDSRNVKTGQVSGSDKIARISDSELYALTIFGADEAIKEFYSARADNMVAKSDMYSKISKYGYVYLDELSSDRSKNQTLNTIDTFMTGAGIKTDLMGSDKEKAAKELKKQIVNDELRKMNLVKEDSNLDAADEVLKQTDKSERPPDENTKSENTLNYYVVYTTNCDGRQLTPRVPNNYMTKNKFEDWETPRVCACSTVDGCLKALSRNLKGERLYVHKIMSNENPITPSPNRVPDAHITGEVWFKFPVRLKCVGQIYVVGDDGKPGYPYKYGGNKTGKLYGWNYKWEAKFSQPVQEDTREYVYIAVNEEEVKRGYIDYPLQEDCNGKYVNLTLEGLESFLEAMNIDEYNYYIKVPKECVDIAVYDEETEGAIIKLPFAHDIDNYKNLNKKGVR